MNADFVHVIERRTSVNLFDPSHTLERAQVEELIRLATLSPSAYNLQNWRFVAVHSAEKKAELRRVAQDQAKVTDAAATVIVVGQLPTGRELPERFDALVKAGLMPQAMLEQLGQHAQAFYQDDQARRDEAVRSAGLAASTLMLAAQAQGLATCPMVGFDPVGVSQSFDLGQNEVPVMLVAIGRAADGNWPQKPRRAVRDVLAFV